MRRSPGPNRLNIRWSCVRLSMSFLPWPLGDSRLPVLCSKRYASMALPLPIFALGLYSWLMASRSRGSSAACSSRSRSRATAMPAPFGAFASPRPISRRTRLTKPVRRAASSVTLRLAPPGTGRTVRRACPGRPDQRAAPSWYVSDPGSPRSPHAPNMPHASPPVSFPRASRKFRSRRGPTLALPLTPANSRAEALRLGGRSGRGRGRGRCAWPPRDPPDRRPPRPGPGPPPSPPRVLCRGCPR